MILLLALFSPFTELFPNLYMSWWAPSNDNLAEYERKWYRRIVVVCVVWAVSYTHLTLPTNREG